METGMLSKRSFRLTKEQEEYLDKNCQSLGITSSAYIRGLLDERRKKQPKLLELTREEREYHARIISEVNRIGVNINQIVKNVNSFFYSRREKEELYQLLEQVYQLLAEERK